MVNLESLLEEVDFSFKSFFDLGVCNKIHPTKELNNYSSTLRLLHYCPF